MQLWCWSNYSLTTFLMDLWSAQQAVWWLKRSSIVEIQDQSALQNEEELMSKYGFSFRAGVAGQTAAVNTTTWHTTLHSASAHAHCLLLSPYHITWCVFTTYMDCINDQRLEIEQATALTQLSHYIWSSWVLLLIQAKFALTKLK